MELNRQTSYLDRALLELDLGPEQGTVDVEASYGREAVVHEFRGLLVFVGGDTRGGSES